jgi:hypothetical protein
MGEDGNQPLPEILLRKEAERITGGDFWWGLGTPLGDRVASAATTNGEVLPALFSAARKPAQSSNQVVRIWNGWCSIPTGQSGTIPKHVLVTGGSLDRPHYALVCRSNAPVVQGNHGTFDPAQCRTVAKGRPPGWSQRAALLTGQTKHSTGRYRITFRAELVAPWFVRLTNDRVLDRLRLARFRSQKARTSR